MCSVPLFQRLVSNLVDHHLLLDLSRTCAAIAYDLKMHCAHLKQVRCGFTQ